MDKNYLYVNMKPLFITTVTRGSQKSNVYCVFVLILCLYLESNIIIPTLHTVIASRNHLLHTYQVLLYLVNTQNYATPQNWAQKLHSTCTRSLSPKRNLADSVI